MKRKTLFSLFSFVFLFSLVFFSTAFAGNSTKLQQYEDSFPRSNIPRAALSGFQGIPFGITKKEFRKLARERDDLKLLGDTTIDRGRKGSRRLRVFLKGEGEAGPVFGNFRLFELDLGENEKVLGQAFFTPEDERLHKIHIIFPDRLYSEMADIERVVRHWYGKFGREFGVPDYLSGRSEEEWGPQKKETLSRENLNHPRFGKGSEGRVFSAWFHHESEWMILILGEHFQYDPNRYQVYLDLSFNYPKGFKRD